MNTVAERIHCRTVREILVAARDLITDPSRHCVGHHACDASEAETAMREIPVQLVVEPVESDAGVTDSVTSECSARHDTVSQGAKQS
jgi:hypothetical protein